MRTARSLLAMSTAVALLAPAGSAGAQSVVTVPGMSLSFLQPTGTVAPTAGIPVWLRLSLAPTADPFTFDASSPGTAFDLPSAVVPTTGTWNGVAGTIASFTSAFTTAVYGCANNTFTPGCGVTPYTFALDAGPSSFVGLPSLSLAPGGSFDFLLGTFTPQPGGAPVGTYAFNYAEARVDLSALDANGDPLIASLFLGSTCPPRTPLCAGFTRTVAGSAVVPEPATLALLGGGLAPLGVVARRRRAA